MQMTIREKATWTLGPIHLFKLAST